jgi:hypothetical protein
LAGKRKGIFCKFLRKTAKRGFSCAAGDIPGGVGDIPRKKKGVPRHVGDVPRGKKDVPGGTGDVPGAMGDVPREKKGVPRRVGDIPHGTGEGVFQGLESAAGGFPKDWKE